MCDAPLTRRQTANAIVEFLAVSEPTSFKSNFMAKASYILYGQIYSVNGRIILILFVIFLLPGCLEEDREEDVHYVSSKPELAECNGRPSIEERENCYYKIALQRSSDTFCEEIGAVNRRNLCLQKVAKAVKNPTICNKIIKDDMRFTECLTGSS